MLTLLTIGSLAVAAFSTVEGHGYIQDPRVTFYNPSIGTSYEKIVTESSHPAFQGLKWNDSPDKNAATFTTAFAKTGYTSLRQYLDLHVSGCGNTRTDVTPVDVSGKSTLKWGNDEYRDGFTPSHRGPCEVWIDNTRVFQDNDCSARYSSYPATLPIDYSKCSGTCTLRLYWLALHQPDWQIYKQCVPIKRGSGTSPSVTPSPNNPTTTPRPYTPPPSNGGGTVQLWGQCGGQGYSGPTTCASGTCKAQNQWYSQCTP